MRTVRVTSFQGIFAKFQGYGILFGPVIVSLSVTLLLAGQWKSAIGNIDCKIIHLFVWQTVSMIILLILLFIILVIILVITLKQKLIFRWKIFKKELTRHMQTVFKIEKISATIWPKGFDLTCEVWHQLPIQESTGRDRFKPRSGRQAGNGCWITWLPETKIYNFIV